ncbi:unnamed protein product [Meloidogyne enterolobii]|uniref:Uncharacterized protein n=1 Tax=Meloidogyne enterolobii TaxID=390850 RepID=A0ACB0YYX5_MELEN
MPKTEIGFKDKTIRQAFVQKVFTLMTIMISVVTVMSAISLFYRDGEKYPLRDYLKKSSGLYFLSLLVFLVVYFAIICCESARRTHPTNLISTGILTHSIGFLVLLSHYYHLITTLLGYGHDLLLFPRFCCPSFHCYNTLLWWNSHFLADHQT